MLSEFDSPSTNQCIFLFIPLSLTYLQPFSALFLLPSHFISLSVTIYPSFFSHVFLSIFTLLSLPLTLFHPLELLPLLLFLSPSFTLSHSSSSSSSLYLTRHATLLAFWLGEDKLFSEIRWEKNTESTPNFLLCKRTSTVGVKFSWSFSFSPAVCCVLKKTEFAVYYISKRECGKV